MNRTALRSAPPILLLLLAFGLLPPATGQEPAAQEAAAAPAEAPEPGQEAQPAEQAAQPAEPAAESAADAAEPQASGGEADARAAAKKAKEEEESAKPKPKLVIPELSKDLGKVRRGEHVSVVFELANEGDALLRIKGAEPSCGCTVTSFDREIAAGKQGRVKAILDTELLDGAVLKGVTLLSNDPLTPKVQLTIRAEIVSFVTVSPSYARLLQVQGLESAHTAVNLWAGDGTALEIGAIATGADWIHATAHPAAEGERVASGPEAQWRVEVSIDSDAPLGPLTEMLSIPTGHPEQPRIDLPLSGFVRPVLAPQPVIADFGVLGRNVDQRKFVVKLFNFGKEPVAVTSAATDLPFVKVTVDPDEPGRRYKLRLALADDAPKGKFEGTLRVESDSALMPVVEIPVRGKVK